MFTFIRNFEILKIFVYMKNKNHLSIETETEQKKTGIPKNIFSFYTYICI